MELKKIKFIDLKKKCKNQKIVITLNKKMNYNGIMVMRI